MMKRFILLFTLAVSLSSLLAQHHIGFSVAPSATLPIEKIENAKPLFGSSGNVGIAYQYKYHELLVQTGVDMELGMMRYGIDSMYFGIDTLCTGRVDRMNKTTFSIPILIGVTVDQFYLLAGAKFILPYSARTTQKATLAVKMDGDDRYFEDFNQAFHNPHLVKSKSNVAMDWEATACIEIGGRFNLYHTTGQAAPVMQFGVFAELGIVNSSLKSCTAISEDGSVEKYIPSIFLSQLAAPRMGVANHLQVGVKATILFNVSKPPCNCVIY